MPLADVFISNDDAVKLINAEVVPTRDLGGVDVKSVDVVKLAKLSAIMTGATFAESLKQIAAVHEVSDDGPWIYRFPAELQSRLAALSEPGIRSTAERWAQTQEFGLNGIGGAAVAAILSDFSRLAKLAEQNGEHVYLWNCL